ncbi:MAG: manganese efflux pump MntP family protein [Candidatus Micrarchaeia archaeon]|jgi:putative Mn2+ efflux pump MntP
MLLALFIALGLSMDSFAVATACGASSKKDRLGHAALLSLSFCLFQTALAAIGWFAGFSFLSAIEAYDHWAAFILLCCVGGKMIYESVFGERIKCGSSIGMARLVGLSLATSVDALAVGIGFAFMGADPALYLSAIAAVTFALSFTGAYFGSRVRGAFGRNAELFGGAVLIAIGIKILLEHTRWLTALF